MTTNRWVMIGSATGFVGVAMGAFGTHALARAYSEKTVAIWQTGAQYQMYHALAIIGFGIWSGLHPNSTDKLPGWAFTVGTALFSGSLYLLALTDIKELGAITPIGGLALMLGWLTFALSAFRYRK